jgi:hypothetical protein
MVKIALYVIIGIISLIAMRYVLDRIAAKKTDTSSR